MNPAVVAEYRAIRKSPDGRYTVPASVALTYARRAANPTFPNFEFTAIGDTMEWPAGKFTITATVERDDYTEPDGRFSDKWSADAIRNPNWRPGAHNVFKWYEGMNSVNELRASYARLGYPRNAAYVNALSAARSAARTDAAGESYSIRVEVTRDGITWGHGHLGGFNVDPDAPGAVLDRQFRDFTEEVAGGALIDARNAWKRDRADDVMRQARRKVRKAERKLAKAREALARLGG